MPSSTLTTSARAAAAAAALALLISGCTSADPDDGGSDSSPTAEQTEESGDTEDTEDTDTDTDTGEAQDGGAEDGEAEDGSSEDGNDGGEEDASDGDPARTDVDPELLLAAENWESIDGEGEVTDGIQDWLIPCEVGAPSAEAMIGVSYGDGADESQVGLHQVAAFASADDAAAEADRIRAELQQCAEVSEAEGETVYVLEDLEVGAQGSGLASDYYGASVDGDLDGALGTYVALTRRGNAITLAGFDGGESTVGVAREDASALLTIAWDQLCEFDSAGC